MKTDEKKASSGGQSRAGDQALHLHPASRQDTDSLPQAADLWRQCGDLPNNNYIDKYRLVPYFARGVDRRAAIGIIDSATASPVNLLLVTEDGTAEYLHPLQPGQYVPCSDYIGTRRVIVAESLLSALSIAHRARNAYVVAALQAWNIAPVIETISTVWPGEFLAAPDRANIQLLPDVRLLSPPTGSSWLAMHVAETQLWAA